MTDLHALGGVGLTNDEISPELRPVSKAPVRSQYYYEATNETGVYVGGTALLAGQLDGLAVLPTQRDTTYWCYVVRNTEDSVYIAGDIRSAVNNGDTMTFYDFHLSQSSPVIGFGDNDYVSTELDIDGDDRIIDADSNGTALVDAGGDEFNPDSTYLPNVMVLSPKADTTLVAGEMAAVCWYAPGINVINIDYTYDIPLGSDPVAWHEVIHDHSTIMPIYLWMVPSIQSARCKIRISDASEPSRYVISDIFHIKQVRLTRFAADSTYEFYKPSEHGWSFDNVVGDMWPVSTWGAIDYSNDNDPYTGQAYPVDDPAYPIGSGDEEYFPNWLLWVETFGEDQCYNSTPSGLMYVMRAMYRWDDVSNLWYGSCVGLSTTSLLTFGNDNLLEPRWSYLNLPYDSIHQMPISEDIREFVNIHQTAAYGVTQWHYYSSGYSIPIDTTLKNIRQQLLNTKRDDAALIIGAQNNRGAHAMVPYAIVSDPSPSKVRIMVYDPDDPSNDNTFVLVDTTAKLWSFSGYPNWGGAHNLYLYYPVKTVIDHPALKTIVKTDQSGYFSTYDDTLIELFYTADADLKLLNVYGDSIGYNDSGLFNSLGEGTPLIPFDVDSTRPFGFLLPNQEFNGTIGNSSDSVIRVSCYYDSLYVGYRRICADSTEIDNFRIFHGLTLSNPDAISKSVQMRMVNTLPDRERAMAAIDLVINADDTAALEPLADSGWYLSNHGQATQYNLWFREVSYSGAIRFYAADVALDSQQAHIITPDWTNLNSDSCWIYIDNDFDKIADDSTILVGDILVEVEDGQEPVLPVKFELLQNYPNPFNPVTTINYSLPRSTDVSIEIFNIVGQKVITLVNETKPAGEYQITWDGQDTHGQKVSTGIYLYRLQTDDYAETKKMLLLK